MRWSAAFAPRDPVFAKRLVAVLTAVAAAVSLTTTVLGLMPSGGRWGDVAVFAPLLVVVCAVAIQLTPQPPAWLWATFPFGGIVAILAADLATHDAGITAQIFFVFPALYAGAQLRRPAAYAVTAAAVTAQLTVVIALLPAREAVRDSGYVVCTIVAATFLLVRAGERVELLIARLQEQAAIDPLTGLVTRRVLDSAASSALESAASNGGTALLLIDVDHFKSVNDVHGHLAGDLVLKEVSALLHGLGRRTDVVSRMGGDEFAMLLSGCTLEAAQNRAAEVVSGIRRLRVDVEAVTMTRGPEFVTQLAVTASVGLAHLPTHANDVHALYQAADVSLYRAKRAGRDRCADLQLDPA